MNSMKSYPQAEDEAEPELVCPNCVVNYLQSSISGFPKFHTQYITTAAVIYPVNITLVNGDR